MLRFFTAPVLTLVEIGQRQIRGNIVRVVTDDPLPGPTRPLVVVTSRGTARSAGGQAHSKRKPSTSDASRRSHPADFTPGPANLLNEVSGNHLSYGGRLSLAQARQHLEDGTVCLPFVRKTFPDGGKPLNRLAGIVDIVSEVAVGQDMNGGLSALGPPLINTECFFTEGMPDAKLVKDIGIVHGNVADDEIGLEDECKHILADVAGLDDLARGRQRSRRRPVQG